MVVRSIASKGNCSQPIDINRAWVNTVVCNRRPHTR